MIVRITDTINHDQAICHHTDVANAAAAPRWAPEDEPIQYTLTPEALALIDGK